MAEIDYYYDNYTEFNEIDEGYDTDDTIPSVNYKYQHSRYGEIVVHIRDLPVRETLFEGNEYTFQDEKIRVVCLLLNEDGSSNKYGRIDLTFEPYIIYTNEIEDFQMDICDFVNLIYNGDIILEKAMYDVYTERNTVANSARNM